MDKNKELQKHWFKLFQNIQKSLKVENHYYLGAM